MGLKRSRSAEFPSHADEPDMHILLSGSQQPLFAHYHVLRHFSTCVRDLPRPMATSEAPLVWDLQQLVLEGDSGPVSAEVVQRWLDLVYSRVDAARRIRRVNNLDETRRVLVFADACGTSQAVIDDIGRRLVDNPDLSLAVPIGEGERQLTVRLPTRDATYYVAQNMALWQLKSNKATEVLSFEDFAPHISAFPAAVCSALESWLHLAGRLGLAPLCRALMDFIKAQLIPATMSILLPAYHSIFSRRVLECMPRELLYEALVRDGLTDSPASVVVEDEEVQVRLNTPLAGAWFGDRSGGTHSMDFTAEKLTRDGVETSVRVVLGGPTPGTVPSIVKAVIAKALEEAE